MCILKMRVTVVILAEGISFPLRTNEKVLCTLLITCHISLKDSYHWNFIFVSLINKTMFHFQLISVFCRLLKNSNFWTKVRTSINATTMML